VAAKRTRTPTTARKKKSKAFCYTKDLTEALGVTRRTLYKYVQGRLLPAPILVSNGKTGVRARWTMAAMEHAEFIREHKDIGYTLGEITAMVAARWGTHDKVPLPEPDQEPTVTPNGNSPHEEDASG
jgi:DNA-binding transcriptional MerR regulator